MKQGFLVSGAMAVLALSVLSGPSWAQDATATGWKPDADLEKQLTVKADVEGTPIELPSGAQRQHQAVTTATMTQTQNVWTVDKDVTILVIVMHPKEGSALPEAAKALEDFEAVTVDTCDKAHRTPQEVGYVESLPAVRNHYTYTSPDAPNPKMTGFSYAAKTADTLVIVGAFTPESSKDKKLPLAETAVLTYLKGLAGK